MIESLLKEYKNRVDLCINKLYPSTDKAYAIVNQASRYSLLLGGKRIRPIVLLLFYKLCGANDNNAENFAVALEMIHTYSLIHDDLPCMDNDDMRRGNPSCHKKFSEDTALLAGDNLLTEAFRVASLTENISADRIVKAIGVLSEKAGERGMLGGQVIDLSFENKNVSIEQLHEMYLKKTGCLLEAASEIGCILAGADESLVLKAGEYSRNLGLAFQVIDDILDCTSSEDILGKPIGSDSKNNKTTYVSLLGIEKSRDIANQLTQKAISCLNSFSGDTSDLKRITEYLLNRNF